MGISKKARIGLLLFVILLALPVAFGADFKVCPSGCPYTTITACLVAINNTVGNACVLNTTGTYTISGSYYFKIGELGLGTNTAIKFQRNNIILDCNHSTISGDNANYGINIGDNYYGGTWAEYNQIKNCRIANYSYAIYAGGGCTSGSCCGGHTIYNNTFNSNTYGINFNCISNTNVINNKFYSNTYGIQSYASNGYATNNYFANNEINGSYGLYIKEGRWTTIKNNTINASNYGIFFSYAGWGPPYNITHGKIIENKIKAGTYGIQTDRMRHGIISNNTFSANSESLYLSNSRFNNISLNSFLSGGVYDNYGNNYCVNSEGNFYEKSLTPFSADCGPGSLTSPTLNITPYNPNITWTRQSSSLPVTYDVFQTNYTDFMASLSPLNYSGMLFNDTYVFADTLGGTDFIPADGEAVTTADGILNFDLFLVNDSANVLGLGAGKKITGYGKDFFANGIINCTVLETANGLSPGDCKYFRHNAFLANGTENNYIFNDTFNSTYNVISSYTTPPYLDVWKSMVNRTTGLYYDKLNFTYGKTYTIDIVPWINGSRIEGTVMSATFTICPTLADNYYVNDDTFLCQQTYQLNDTGNNGLLIINASDITLDCNGATLIGNDKGKAIYINHFHNVTIKNCNIHNYTEDIYLDHSNYSKIFNNNLFANFSDSLGGLIYRGIYGEYSYYPEITSNNITAYQGIYFQDSGELLISGNRINSNDISVNLYYSDVSEIFSNYLSSNQSNSVYLSYSDYSDVKNNFIYYNISNLISNLGSGYSAGQVHAYYSSFINMINNTCVTCEGFEFYGSDNCSAINNTVTYFAMPSGLGGFLVSYSSDDVLFQGNNITDTMGLLGAAYIDNSANVTFKENSIKNNFIGYMLVQNSEDVFIANNTMISTYDAWYLNNVSELFNEFTGQNYTGPGAQLPWITIMFAQLLAGTADKFVITGNITGLYAPLTSLIPLIGPLFFDDTERVDFIDNDVSFTGFEIAVEMNASNVDIKNNYISGNMGVGTFEMDNSIIKNNIFIINSSGLLVNVSGNKLNLVNNTAEVGFIGAYVKGGDNQILDNEIIMEDVALDVVSNANFSEVKNLVLGGFIGGLGIEGTNATVQNNRINVKEVGVDAKVYGNATEVLNVNITPIYVGLLALTSAADSLIFNNTGIMSDSKISVGINSAVSSDVQNLMFYDARAGAVWLSDSDNNTLQQNRFTIQDVGINASVTNEHIDSVKSRNLTFTNIMIESDSESNRIINNSFVNCSLPYLAFSFDPNKAANSSILAEVCGAVIRSDSPDNYFAYNDFINTLADTSALDSAFNTSLDNLVLVERAGIIIESTNNTIYANTFYNTNSTDALIFAENNTLLLNHFLSGGASGQAEAYYTSYSPIHYNGENFNDTYIFVNPADDAVITANNQRVPFALGTNSFDLFLFNDTTDLLDFGAGKLTTMLCAGCYDLGMTSCAVLEAFGGMNPGDCRYYKRNAFIPQGRAFNYSWADAFDGSYYVMAGNPTPPYLAANTTSVGLLNTVCSNGNGNFYEEDLTPLEGDCGPANITTFTVGGGQTNVLWKNQSAHSLVTYDIFVNNTVTGEVYLLGSTTGTNFSIDTTTYDSSYFSIELVPWVTGSRFNGTHVTSPMFMPGIIITYPPAGSTVNGTVNITFIGTNLSPEISFDGGNWTPTTGANNHLWDTANFTVGSHIMQVREFMGTGFIYSRTLLVYVGETAIPPANITFAVYDEGDWSRHNESLYAYWTTTLAGNVTYNYSITDDTASAVIRNFTSVGNATSVNATNLTLVNSHSYTFFVIMFNETNHQVINGSSDGIKVDYIDPNATLESTTHPDQNATYLSTSVSFNWSAADAHSGIRGFSYLIDSNPLTTPDNAIELPGTADSVNLTAPSGTSWVHFKTLDYAGNYVVIHYKLTIVAPGAVIVTLYPHASPTNKDLIDLKGTISQNVSNMTLFVNGLASNVSVELKLADLEFEFNNVSIDAGINAIYAAAYINSTAVGTSNTIYVELIPKGRTNITEFTIECGSCGNADTRIIHSSGPNAIPGTSRYPRYGAGTDASGTPVSGATVTASKGANSFIFVTRPEAPLNERNGLLEDRELFDQISPSLGYRLDPDEYEINIIINYADMLIAGDEQVQQGRYNLIIKNNGVVNGIPNITIEII